MCVVVISVRLTGSVLYVKESLLMPNGQSLSISHHSAVSEGWRLENTRAEFYLFSSIHCIFNCNSVFYLLGEPLVQVFPSFKVILFLKIWLHVTTALEFLRKSLLKSNWLSLIIYLFHQIY